MHAADRVAGDHDGPPDPDPLTTDAAHSARRGPWEPFCGPRSGQRGWIDVSDGHGAGAGLPALLLAAAALGVSGMALGGEDGPHGRGS